jgi:hypothetical protein
VKSIRGKKPGTNARKRDKWQRNTDRNRQSLISLHSPAHNRIVPFTPHHSGSASLSLSPDLRPPLFKYFLPTTLRSRVKEEEKVTKQESHINKVSTLSPIRQLHPHLLFVSIGVYVSDRVLD